MAGKSNFESLAWAKAQDYRAVQFGDFDEAA
jgi:hypothetical protein